jgi:CRISPR-associated protein Cas2
MDILVTYDIRTADSQGERRLARVAAVCERYGLRVQYSVFECRVSELSLERLISELNQVIEPGQDSVNVYRIPGTIASVRESLGRNSGRQLGQPWIL